MPEQFDVYTDAFLVTVTPFGASLSFERREPHPSQTAAPVMTRLGTIRMSVEHLKLMTIMLKRQVKLAEEEGGVEFDVDTRILSQLHIAREDWDSFWR
jgi:hypothetical protein